MQSTQAKVKDLYEGGFPKEIRRNKYNLPINQRLKAARNRKGLSAAQVVKELKKQGVSIGHSTLQGYEADENSLNHRYPSLPVLITLSNFYGCSLDYIFGNTDKFKVSKLSTRDTEIEDILGGSRPITYNGKKLSDEQKNYVLFQLDLVLALAKETPLTSEILDL